MMDPQPSTSTNLEKKLNKYDNSLLDFLNKYSTSKPPYSHTGVGTYIGKYNIEGTEALKQFYKLYFNAFKRGNVPIHLIEQHTDICPVIIDIDLKYNDGVKTRQYDNNFIKTIVKIYTDEIIKLFDLNISKLNCSHKNYNSDGESSENSKNGDENYNGNIDENRDGNGDGNVDGEDEDSVDILHAFVFQRPEPYVSKEILKDGIHIIFPFIVSKPEAQYYIRDAVIQNPETEKIFNSLPLQNSIANAIDRSIIENVGFYMYGSTKPNVALYDFTMLLDYNQNELQRNIYPEKGLFELLSIRNKKETTPIRDSMFHHLSKYKQKLINRKRKDKKKSTITDDEIQDIYELVCMLKDERADDYEEWLHLGWALHNRDPNCEDLLLIWDDFSKKSLKYEPMTCEKYWDAMRDEGLTIGSLYHWAQEDNPVKFRELRNRQIRTYVEQSITGTNVDIAKVLYKMYKYNHVCASIRNKRWYVFNNHRWIEDEDGITLRSKISNELLFEYCKLISFYNEKLTILEDELDTQEPDKGNANTTRGAGANGGANGNANGNTNVGENDKTKKTNLDTTIKNIELKVERLTGITNKLKTTSFKDNIMKECKELFYDKEFFKKVDENKYLMCFNNGVLNLKTGDFFEGSADNFISLSTGINYIKYSEDLPYLDEINLFLSQIQPNPNNRHFMMVLLSSILEGHNADESFHLWTGTGGNGKSKINELLVAALGEYALKLPITLLTNKRAASNAATPEVVESKGRRYCYFEEPSENERMNVGLMKEFTGGDKVKGRALYSSFIEFKPQFKLILFCNDLPVVPPHDEATWRRIVVLEFQSKFVDNPTQENEFKRDKYLTDKLLLWTETFMSLITHYYFTYYKKTGLKIPDEVKGFIAEYQRNVDDYIDFIHTFLLRTDSKSDKIEFNEIYDEFKEWYAIEHDGVKPPPKKEIRKYIEKKFGKKAIGNKYLYGFIKKETEPQIDGDYVNED